MKDKLLNNKLWYLNRVDSDYTMRNDKLMYTSVKTSSVLYIIIWDNYMKYKK